MSEVPTFFFLLIHSHLDMFSLSNEYSDVHFNFRYQRQKGELREGSSD
jgi:hypothetical protein